MSDDGIYSWFAWIFIQELIRWWNFITKHTVKGITDEMQLKGIQESWSWRRQQQLYFLFSLKLSLSVHFILSFPFTRIYTVFTEKKEKNQAVNHHHFPFKIIQGRRCKAGKEVCVASISKSRTKNLAGEILTLVFKKTRLKPDNDRDRVHDAWEFKGREKKRMQQEKSKSHEGMDGKLTSCQSRVS